MSERTGKPAVISKTIATRHERRKKNQGWGKNVGRRWPFQKWWMKINDRSHWAITTLTPSTPKPPCRANYEQAKRRETKITIKTKELTKRRRMKTRQNSTEKQENKSPPKKQRKRLARPTNHRTLCESLIAFCNIVSLTAPNISRIFFASVACVKLTTMSIEKVERQKVARHTGDTRSIVLYLLA